MIQMSRTVNNTPYIRQVMSTGHCLLCGSLKASEVAEDRDMDAKGGHPSGPDGPCRCPPAAQCQACHSDMEAAHQARKSSHQAIYRLVTCHIRFCTMCR